jgi:hypothetical protein
MRYLFAASVAICGGALGQPATAQLGDFIWQDGGDARAVRNVGTTRVELVEFELE